MQITFMRLYVHNKYFNWIALNVIQRFNTWAEVLKRTAWGHSSFEHYRFRLLVGTPLLTSKELERLPSVLDPIVMECSKFRAFFWASSRSLTIPLTQDRWLWLRGCTLN